MLHSLLIKLGLADLRPERNPITVFLLDDDQRRHRWFAKRFEGDDMDIAETVAEAKEFLQEYNYDAIFLDHDLLPHHYESNDHDDFANTGYAIAEWRPGCHINPILSIAGFSHIPNILMSHSDALVPRFFVPTFALESVLGPLSKVPNSGQFAVLLLL